jgi:serine phosphatase RsbU (regulator of sigma subunit)/PAS domain-containing protein
MTNDRRAGSRPPAPHAVAPAAADADTPDQSVDISDLKSRVAALRQAVSLPQADSHVLLDAALAELDGAIAALDGANGAAAGPGSDGRALSGLHSDRRLLHAIFADAPVPLYVVDSDGTVLRANGAAAQMLGVGPGYATGKSLAALVEPQVRAALRSQLAAAGRTSTATRLSCGMLSESGVVRCQFEIQRLSVRGDADRLLVTVTADPGHGKGTTTRAEPAPPQDAGRVDDASVASSTRRLDLLADAARMLLESTTVSESVLVQRSARLVSGRMATWAIVDVQRRGQLRRHYVAGPDDPAQAGLTQAAAIADPGPGSIPDQVFDSGQSLILSHIDDEMALGTPADGPPLLALLGGASVLAVPITDGVRQLGALTLVRRPPDGQFKIADAAIAEQIGVLLGLAIAARRTLRQRTEAADALRASLLPSVLKPVPGVEIASAHLAPTRGREVGGDFYDVYPTPGGWGVAIGDVCGKGEDAAAATAAARHAIRVLAHSTAGPADVLRGANEIMLAEEFGGRFVTASVAHLSWRDTTLRVVLATAGHPGPVIIRPDGRTERVPGGGVPLGIFPDPEPATVELELAERDVLFCYTDGLTDARSPQATYLEDSLSDCLAQLAGRQAADIVADMRRAVLDFSDGVLHDDLTMLALRAGRPPAS